MVKIGVLRLIKIILRWSTFDIGTRILHNSHWINRIWMGIQLDLIVFKSYFKYSWGGYECITSFRGNCHVIYTRYMFRCTRVFISDRAKHWDVSFKKTFFLWPSQKDWVDGLRMALKFVFNSLRYMEKGVGVHCRAIFNIFCLIYTLFTTHRSSWL